MVNSFPFSFPFFFIGYGCPQKAQKRLQTREKKGQDRSARYMSRWNEEGEGAGRESAGESSQGRGGGGGEGHRLRRGKVGDAT